MSSLLIKGVIMPLTCEECPCYDANDNSCNVTGQRVIEYIYSGRPDNCPLVEIPSLHGRLIDAEKILIALTNDFHGLSLEQVMTIKDFPPIIEAEVSE